MLALLAEGAEGGGEARRVEEVALASVSDELVLRVGRRRVELRVVLAVVVRRVSFSLAVASSVKTVRAEPFGLFEISARPLDDEFEVRRGVASADEDREPKTDEKEGLAER